MQTDHCEGVVCFWLVRITFSVQVAERQLYSHPLLFLDSNAMLSVMNPAHLDEEGALVGCVQLKSAHCLFAIAFIDCS